MSHSTPLRPLPNLYAEHKRDDMQNYAAYNVYQPSEEDRKKPEQYEEERFNALLNLLDLDSADPILNPSATSTPGFNSRTTFVNDANRASRIIKQAKSE